MKRCTIFGVMICVKCQALRAKILMFMFWMLVLYAYSSLFKATLSTVDYEKETLLEFIVAGKSMDCLELILNSAPSWF